MNSETIIRYTIISAAIIAVSFRPGTAAASNTSALDVDGNQLQSNTKYHLLAPRGGVALAIRDRRDPCPPNVVQESGGSSAGLSLKLFPADGKKEIDLQSDLNVVVMAATVCVQRTVWRLGAYDRTTGRRYVRSNGEVGQPGAATVRNWFKIEGAGEGYRIVYCPSVCSTCRVECGVVGVYVEKGRRWLGLGGQPLLIAFKKVNH